MFSFGLLFSLKPLCGSGKSFGAPSNQLTSIPQLVQCVYVRASLGFDSTSREKLGELAKMSSDTKNSFSLNWFQRMGLIWCFVMSPEHENTWSVLERVTHCVDEVCMGVFKCTSTCTYACVCVCVWYFAYFLLVYRATWKFPCAGWDCLLFSLQTRPKHVGATLTIVAFHRSRSRLYLFDQWMWTVEVCVRYCQFAVSWRHQSWMEKNCCRISYYLCFSAAQPEKWKGSEL